MRARISLALGTFLLLAGLGISQEKPELDICKEFLKNSVALVVLPQPFIVREENVAEKLAAIADTISREASSIREHRWSEVNWNYLETKIANGRC